MYKRRDAALAELVANSWDASAHNVWIELPSRETYSPTTGTISIRDDGAGMTEDEVEQHYLPIGRNRRQRGVDASGKRKVMGRKGIGKLAGFGMAKRMTVSTWRDGVRTQLTLDIDQLKLNDNIASSIQIDGVVEPYPEPPHVSGTQLTLSGLKHESPIDIDLLHTSLSRRFGRVVRGEMAIMINGERLREMEFEFVKRVPDEGHAEETLESGASVRYWYGFTSQTIKEPQLRGFVVYVRDRTAQAPPFYFDVEGTATGQHSTKYVTGEIYADFLDDGAEDEDLISTDRQELDWENVELREFRDWGDKLSRKALAERAKFQGDEIERSVLDNPDLAARIARLDNPSQTEVSKFLRQLGAADPESERVLELAGSLVAAYEYRHFHDFIRQIENVGDDPAELERLLEHLGQWKVLESRAILEIIKGRIDIIEKFREMIVNNSPETASKISSDNMHDLIAGNPWLLHPEWQVLSEEKAISTQLRDWGRADLVEEGDDGLRYDFIALSAPQRLIVIEIKRSQHAVTLDEVQRLSRYAAKLGRAYLDIRMMFISGGTFNIPANEMDAYRRRPDMELMTWAEIYQRTQTYYAHYRAVLEGDVGHEDFARKEKEVAQTRSVLQRGTVHRTSADRRTGIGPQEVNYLGDK